MNSSLNSAVGNVLMPSEEAPENATFVQGYDFNRGIDYEKILDSYLATGFQATHFARAVEAVEKMIECRNEPCTAFEETFDYPISRKKRACTIFLGYTSNLVTSGLRDIFRYLAQHDMIDCIVTSAGGIEEDFIKCLKPTFVGDFRLAGNMLRKKGLNRAGNLLIPNSNYCAFESWLTPILEQMSREQSTISWTPSKIIQRLGREIDNEESIYYWAYKNGIPVFCPALTDGSLGDMIYFFNARAETPLKIDIAEDLGHINTMAVKSQNTGVIILGGGFVKHHICNANLMRNGANFAVYINTGQEFDGSDSGASPDEAVSWGKLRDGIEAVKVNVDATLIFPLLVAKTFAKTQVPAGGAPSIANGQCEYAQSNKAVEIDDKVIPRPYVGWFVCSNGPNCNKRGVDKDTANLAWDDVTNTVPCTISTSKTRCIECSHVDGRGRCHHDTKTTCAGAYCTKLNGKLNGRWFEIRGCANINPLGVLTCTSYQKTMVIEQLGGSINQSYWANSCMCQGESCNTASSFSTFLPMMTIAVFICKLTIL
ncbi:hypothetical protein M3Y98_00924600 [Aphelenchoides besseyi]|nr:hypothetical protein M3Y98_00924600 [Aphelenchoides besseyi]